MINMKYTFIITSISMLVLTYAFTNMIDDIYNENKSLREKVLKLSSKLEEIENIECYDVNEHKVTLTMYNPTYSQCDNSPDITADGTKINIHNASNYRYVALSRDLLKRWGGPFDYGDYIIIDDAGNENGIYQVRDTMSPKYIKRVDVLKTKGHRQFKYSDVKMYKYLDKNEFKSISYKE